MLNTSKIAVQGKTLDKSNLTWLPLFLSVHGPLEAFCERTLDFSDLVASHETRKRVLNGRIGNSFYRLMSTG